MERLPIWPLAKTGLADMAGAIRRMPGLFVLFYCASLAVALLDAIVPVGLPHAIRIAVALAASAAVTSSVAVTLHRYVILSEVNGARSLASRWPTLLDFATVVLAAQLFMVLPALVALLIWGGAEKAPAWVTPVTLAFVPVTCVILVRHLLVFPAVAVGAPDRSLATAARGGMRLILPVVLACLFAMLLIGLASSLVGLPVLLASADVIVVTLVLTTAIELVISATTVAIVSRAYLWRGGQPLP